MNRSSEKHSQTPTVDDMGGTKMRWETDDDTSISVAAASFAAAVGKGHAVFSLVDNVVGKRVLRFDPGAGALFITGKH